MTAAERHSRATALFLATADLAPEAREATLEAEADAEIRDAARALLRGHDSATGPLDAPAVSPLAEARVTGREIGPWRITGRLGSGGMGAVYRAERADGLYDREVALKLLAPGVALAGGEWLARRLDAERRILARLEHPGIARLYDGGITDDGLPYLAMELVDGEPITDYADAHALGLRQRLRLMVQACEAVAYAHRRLVVHRDLKPSNLLVASGDAGAEDAAGGQAGGARGDPVVKLLDFGVASLLEDGLSHETVRRVMTPAYAAPEQVRGERRHDGDGRVRAGRAALRASGGAAALQPQRRDGLGSRADRLRDPAAAALGGRAPGSGSGAGAGASRDSAATSTSS